MPVTYQGGQSMPAFGTPAYAAQFTAPATPTASSPTTAVTGGGGGGGTSYTYTSGGQTYTATPNANITAQQAADVANNPLYKPVIAPTTVAQVQNIPNINYNNLQTPVNTSTNTLGANTYLAGSQAGTALQKDVMNQQFAVDTATANSKNANTSSVSNLLNANPVTPATNLTNADNQFGVNSIFAQKTVAEAAAVSAQQQLANIQNSVTEQQSKFASGTEVDFANNMNAQIQRNAQPQINAAQAAVNVAVATVAYLNNDYTQAEAAASKAADAMTQQQTSYRDNITAIYNLAQSQIDILAKPMMDALATEKDLATQAAAQAYDENKSIATWASDPKEAGAGITVNDSYDTALAKKQAWDVNPKNPEVKKAAADLQLTQANARKANEKTPTATEGQDLSDAMTYMKAHPEVSPDTVKQRFLQSHPSSSAAWDNYFTATDSSKQTYPTAPAAPADNSVHWYNPFSWFN